MKLTFIKFFSRKFWMTLFGMAVLWLAFWKQVDYLYSFGLYADPLAGQLITAYVSITRDFMLVFSAVILGYLGINGVVSWKHGSESIVQQVSEAITSRSEEQVDERIVRDYQSRYAGDPSYRPVQIDVEERFR